MARRPNISTRPALDDIVKPPVAAQKLDTTVKTLAMWRWQHKGPPYIALDGGHIRYRLSDLDAWLDSQTVDPGAA